MGKRSFFPRLALVNLVRNSRYYGPYLLSCGALAAMYYILRFLTWNEVIQTVRGAAYLQVMMSIGCFVVALFSTVLLLYANSFVMKRRQKELGLYNILGLDKLDCTVALLKNVVSSKLGRKDIIKIDRILELDWDVIGYVDPGITVNIIKDGVRVEKRQLKLPERITNVIRCKNPRCITSVEQELPQVFKLTDRDKRIYRCLYCEAKAEH